MALPEGEQFVKIDAISCKEYINGPYWDGMSLAEKDSALGELDEPDE